MKWTDLLNFDVMVIVVIAAMVVYCVYVSKRKVYPFEPLSVYSYQKSQSNPNQFPFGEKKKKKKKFNKHEERCREIFQSIFKQPFKTIRPKWLKNPATGKKLELDGFCPTIKTRIGIGLAFEYDGVQHDKYTPHFHKGGVHEYKYQDVKDKFKSQKCKEEGVLLVRIPHYVAFEDLDRFIRNKLREEGLLGGNIEPAFVKVPKDPLFNGLYS